MFKRKKIIAGIVVLALAVIASACGITSANIPQTDDDQTPFQISDDEFMGGTVPVNAQERPVKEFTLTVTEQKQEITDGVEVVTWAFGLEGQEATVPGPELKVQEGDLVRIRLKNTHHQPHTIHLHGVTSVSQEMDGVPSTSLRVNPGEDYVYEFVAKEPGVIVYHCHEQTFQHLDYGMYGMLIVEPKEPYVKYDREYNLILDEWDSTQDPSDGAHDPHPDYTLINGKAFPDTEPIVLPEGEVGLVRLVNMGYYNHSMHTHGMSFYVISKDGYPLTEPFKADTLDIAPGERYEILLRGRDGVFPFHDHALHNVRNKGLYPGGILTLIQGSETSKSSEDQQEDTVDVSEMELQSGEVSTNIENMEFQDPVLRIKAGTKVTWTNNDSMAHTVTEGKPSQGLDDNLFDSGLFEPGESWSYTFEEPGTYDYFCLPHVFMTGQVVVE